MLMTIQSQPPHLDSTYLLPILLSQPHWHDIQLEAPIVLCQRTLFSLFLIPGFFLKSRLYSTQWLGLPQTTCGVVGLPFLTYVRQIPIIVACVLQGMCSSTNTDPKLLHVSWPIVSKPSYTETLELSVWTFYTIQKNKLGWHFKNLVGDACSGVKKPRTMMVNTSCLVQALEDIPNMPKVANVVARTT